MMKQLKEKVQQFLSEISKETLQKYSDKAFRQAERFGITDIKQIHKLDLNSKRAKGMSRAGHRLHGSFKTKDGFKKYKGS